MNLAKTDGEEVFKSYTTSVLFDSENKPNLYYAASTRDLWSKVNREWEKCRSFAQALLRLQPIKESYIERG